MKNPKIGIRRIIDGRWGGVRESLEEQTMNMALSAKKLIESALRYTDGTPVQCVISGMSIGGGAEAAKCAKQFAKENVCGTLSVTPCWCYGSETMDIDPLTVKAVWGFNGTERPGAVYLAAVMAAHTQRGLPAFSIYGHDVQDMNDTEIPGDVAEKILTFARGAVAVGSMRGESYVNFGSVAMGIGGSYCDADFFLKYLGIRPEWVDMTEILRRITLEIYDKNEYEKALNWVKQNCREGFDCNAGKKLPDIITSSKFIPADKDWEFIVKFTLVTRDIMHGNPELEKIGRFEEALGRNAIAAGFQGQRMWTDWLPNADFTESINNTTFDWNGKRAPIIFATENDTLNGITMLMLNLLTNCAPLFSDVRTYWSPDAVKRVTGKELSGIAENGVIHLINSGATALDATGASMDNGNGCMKTWYDMTDSDIEACLNASDWCRANYEYFRGGGFSSHFKTGAEMPVTMARLCLADGIGPVMQIAEGYTAVLDDDIHTVLDKRTDPSWPTTWFAPRLTGEGAFKDVYSVMSNWGANHGAWVYGHIGAQLITLCSMLRIHVNMHNVPKDKIFRPHTVSSFGTENQESADFEYCRTYGALYGKKL